jgi:hypothetical protein
VRRSRIDRASPHVRTVRRPTHHVRRIRRPQRGRVPEKVRHMTTPAEPAPGQPACCVPSAGGSGLLHGVLGIGQRAKQPVGEQPMPLASYPRAGPGRAATAAPLTARLCRATARRKEHVTARGALDDGMVSLNTARMSTARYGQVPAADVDHGPLASEQARSSSSSTPWSRAGPARMH